MADTAATAGAGSSGTRSGSKQSTNPADNYHLARRRTLQVVVSSLLTEAGFESAEKASVETLTEMLQSYISEIGRSAKSYCEHTARTQPTLSDIVVTLVEMGFNVDTLPAYAKRSQRMVITAPPVTNQPVTPKALTAGQNRPHPPHIPSHFPEFPDPHTYIKTPTYREPVSDYQVLREKAASQRRDVERALTRFMAKTGKTQSLFKDDVSTFPLIAARPFTIPYLTALLPSELEMQQMEETDSSEQDEQTDTENLSLHISTDDSGAEKENASVLQQNPALSGSRNGEENIIDNPYLRPVKKPKIRRKKLRLKHVFNSLSSSSQRLCPWGAAGLRGRTSHGLTLSLLEKNSRYFLSSSSWSLGLNPHFHFIVFFLLLLPKSCLLLLNT
ncbi:transcription initiation factor TFIID subunit 8 isoform X1 [Erinaceus europaeus]|uniref:Transcription initiation factor TFIID subunit 8 n=1 Tax=Erinaceus europaeus TaxID=9365 RepID=A0ABM3XAE5_ERIEU|nr:transcription initiation factor TFIID subunit 8 isoform X1 [Erinaceus europaeus]